MSRSVFSVTTTVKVVSDVESGAQVNVIESIERNGVVLPITDKSVNILVPTDSELSKLKLKKYQIPSDGIVNNDTGEISGTSIFSLPDDFNFNSESFCQDGSILAQYSLNSTAKTITFALTPLPGTCFIYYYAIWHPTILFP